MTIKMAVPAGVNNVLGQSGTSYAVDSNGQVNVNAGDVLGLLNAGFTIIGSTGLVGIRLGSGRNSDGTIIATGAAGKFAMSSTLGTSLVLTGEAATGNTKTDTAMFEYVVPDDAQPGTDFLATVNVGYSGSGVVGTKTVQVKAYKVANVGTQGADISTGAAQTLSGATNADYSFAIAGATLSPGDRVMIAVVVILQETGGSVSLTATVNSLRLAL